MGHALPSDQEGAQPPWPVRQYSSLKRATPGPASAGPRACPRWRVPRWTWSSCQGRPEWPGGRRVPEMDAQRPPGPSAKPQGL